MVSGDPISEGIKRSKRGLQRRRSKSWFSRTSTSVRSGPKRWRSRSNTAAFATRIVSVLNNEWGISQYPAVLGHEVVGRVTAVGPAAKGVKVGQRVGVGWTAASCMHCRQCMSGDQHLWPRPSRRFVGHRGGFATHVRCHWAWAIPLPEGLNVRRGRPAVVRRHHRFQSRSSCTPSRPAAWAIVGIGGLGHMAVKFAAAYGCDVTAFTSSESKFDEARGFGANHVVSSRDSAAIKKLAGTIDLLIVTVNVPLDWDALIAHAGPERPDALRRRGARNRSPWPSSADHGAAEHLRLADRLAGGYRDDAGVRGATRRHAADRALPDEPNQRGVSAARSGQGALSHRAGRRLLKKSPERCQANSLTAVRYSPTIMLIDAFRFVGMGVDPWSQAALNVIRTLVIPLPRARGRSHGYRLHLPQLPTLGPTSG